MQLPLPNPQRITFQLQGGLCAEKSIPIEKCLYTFHSGRQSLRLNAARVFAVSGIDPGHSHRSHWCNHSRRDGDSDRYFDQPCFHHHNSGSGVYTFNGLPPDQFTLTVTAPGFKKKSLDNVKILPEQANAVNVTLELGQTTQTVTVNGSQAAALDTETATLSGNIDSNEIQHLPSFNRDVFQLAQLAPGTFGDGFPGERRGQL